MKIFTKSVLVAIAMMAGVTTVSAQDEGWKDPEQWFMCHCPSCI